MTSNQNINNIFFNGVYKEVWRQLIPPGLTEAEVDFIEDIALLKSNDRVLDAMCGYGRHALELARRGYHVTAVDNQQDYIREIVEKCEAENLTIDAQVASILDYELSGTYTAAVCMGNSFAFFDEAQATVILKKIAAHLLPGGVFIINTWMLGEIAIKYFKERDWFYAGDYKYLIENKYAFDPSRIESEHIIIAPDGSSETINAIDYIFTLPELEALFQQAGFKLKNIYSTPRKRSFSFGDTRAYIVAERS